MRVWAKGNGFSRLKPPGRERGETAGVGQRPEVGRRERWCSLGSRLEGRAVAGREGGAATGYWRVGRWAAQPALPPDAAPLRFAAQVKRMPLGGSYQKSRGWNKEENTQMKKAFLVASLILLAIAIIIVVSYYSRTSDKIRLTIRVIHLLDQSVVTGATVEVVSSNGRVVRRHSLDAEGITIFELSPGTYVVRMASGYTGQAEIDLQFEKEVILRVIPVLR